MTEVTRILSAIEQGDPHAAEQLLPLVYDELRKLAAQKLAQEKPDGKAAAGDPDITNKLLKGVKLGDREYKNHLDGYNQMDMLLGKGPSARHEFFYFGGPHLGAVRLDEMKFTFIQQPQGWPGPKVTTDMPALVNLRQDPFERYRMIAGETPLTGAFGYGNEFYALGATHLFEEPGTLEEVARLGKEWFRRHLMPVEAEALGRRFPKRDMDPQC